MENTVTGKNNILSLALLYVVLTVAGCALSVLYIFANFYSPIIQLSVIFLVVYAIALSACVKYLLIGLKIDSKLGSVIVVILAFLTIMYFKWNLFYAIHYLRYSYAYVGYDVNFIDDIDALIKYFIACLKYPSDFFRSMSEFNRVGTWSFGDSGEVISGLMLWVVWAVEFVWIIVPFIMSSLQNYGVLVTDGVKWTWATPSFVSVPFDKFDDYDFDKLRAGDINAIIEHPTAAKPNGRITHRLALFKVNDEFTGIIAVYTFIIFSGKTLKRMSSRPIEIGKELAEKLSLGFDAKYSVPDDVEISDDVVTDDFFDDSTDSDGNENADIENESNDEKDNLED